MARDRADQAPGGSQSRAYFEHVLFGKLSRRAKINNRQDLIRAMKEVGLPAYPELIRRNLHQAHGLNEDFVKAIKKVAPNLTEQDWIEIYWARFFPEEEPPRL